MSHQQKLLFLPYGRFFMQRIGLLVLASDLDGTQLYTEGNPPWPTLA